MSLSGKRECGAPLTEGTARFKSSGREYSGGLIRLRAGGVLELYALAHLIVLAHLAKQGHNSGEGQMEDQWLRQAKRLQAIASSGLHFTHDPFDRQRYEEIGLIANEMLAALGAVPVERIAGLVSDFAKGYSTPKVDVRGALIEDNKILLVRETSDGHWALPGGFADVGLSAAENIVKEFEEEAGLNVAVSRLIDVRHKAKHDYRPDARDFYKLLFLCRRMNDNPPNAGIETSEIGFFPLDRLPQLSTGRTIVSDIETAFAFQAGSMTQTVFD